MRLHVKVEHKGLALRKLKQSSACWIKMQSKENSSTRPSCFPEAPTLSAPYARRISVHRRERRRRVACGVVGAVDPRWWWCG